jgi:hypothetical protein
MMTRPGILYLFSAPYFVRAIDAAFAVKQFNGLGSWTTPDKGRALDNLALAKRKVKIQDYRIGLIKYRLQSRIIDFRRRIATHLIRILQVLFIQCYVHYKEG